MSRAASIIGHLIGTPLNVIAGRAGLIRASADPQAGAEHAQRIEQQVGKLAERIRRLIDAFTVSEPASDQRPGEQVVQEALALYQPIAAYRGVALEFIARTPLAAQVDGASGAIVLTMLLSLATRTANPGTTVRLEAEAVPAGLRFTLTVPGLDLGGTKIDRLDVPIMADPATADRLQVLSLCLAIANRHGGSLEVLADSSREAGVVQFECVAC